MLHCGDRPQRLRGPTPKNEAHAQRLLAAVRGAMTDRDVTAADASIRKLGAEGFSTEVVGA
jgi:hypothetical protein